MNAAKKILTTACAMLAMSFGISTFASPIKTVTVNATPPSDGANLNFKANHLATGLSATQSGNSFKITGDANAFSTNEASSVDIMANGTKACNFALTCKKDQSCKAQFNNTVGGVTIVELMVANAVIGVVVAIDGPKNHNDPTTTQKFSNQVKYVCKLAH